MTQVSGIREHFVTLSKYKMSKVYFKNKKMLKNHVTMLQK